MATTHQVLFLTTFFSKPESSAEIGTFILSMTSSLFYLVFFKFSDSKFALITSSLFPQAAITINIVKVCNLSMGMWEINISESESFFMLVFDVFIYFLLYVYCDAIIPNEYGVNRHPLFCLHSIISKINKLQRKIRNQGERIEFLNVEMNESLRNEDIALSENTTDRFDESKVFIKGISKTFGDVKAVNNLSFEMSSGQLLWYLSKFNLVY